jgi:hypothetical protein
MTGERLADRLLMLAWLSMWAPNIIFALLGLLLVHYAIRERISIRLPKKLEKMFRKFRNDQNER